MARVYKTFCFLEIKIDIPTTWSQGTPSFRIKRAEMCYLYRRMGRSQVRGLRKMRVNP